MNAIKWTPKAAKQLRKLDRQNQVLMRDAAESLESMANCRNVKALTSHAFGYRLRVGNFRILFDWYGEIRIVEIQEIKKRDERTY